MTRHRTERRRRLRRGGQQLGRANVRTCLPSRVRRKAHSSVRARRSSWTPGSTTGPCATSSWPRGPAPGSGTSTSTGPTLSAFDTGVGFTARAGGAAGAGRGHRELAGEPVSVILSDADGVVLERRHRRLVAGAGARPDLAGPRLQLRGEARRHQRHRHRAGGRRPGRGLRPRALRGAPGGVRLRGRARVAPGQQQAARRHRPHLLAPRRRTVHVHGRGRASRRQIEAALHGAVRAPRARAAARLPDRLPAQQRDAVFAVEPRPADAQRPGARAARPRRPGHAPRRGHRGAGLRAPRCCCSTCPRGLIARVQCGRAGSTGAPRAACCRCSWPRRGAEAAGRQPGAGHRAARRRRQRPAVGEVPPGRRPALPQPRVARAGGRAGHGQDHARARHPPAPHPGGAPADPRRRGLRARAGSPTSPRSSPPAAARWCSPTSTGCPTRRRQVLVDALGALPRVHRRTTGLAGRHRRAAAGLGRPDDPVDLLEFFPRTVVVPPLRHHVEDVAELVPHFIARLTRGAELSCSPEAMRLLMRNRWPGNIEQLYQVLRKTVARRRAGVLAPDDLPPECGRSPAACSRRWRRSSATRSSTRCWTTTATRPRRPATSGMSRATIYRKIRGYGISTPTTG